MSFGLSLSDITNLIQLTARTYRGWKKACGSHADIIQDLESLKIVLSRVVREVKVSSSSSLHNDKDLRQLKAIVRNCRDVVSQLEYVVSKYKDIATSRRSNWNRIRFGQKNLGGLRDKLMVQVIALGTYLETLGISTLGHVESSVKVLPEMKRVIDSIAEDIRAGRREGSVMTTHEHDEKQVWQQFRRELIAVGFTSKQLKMVKVELCRYLQELVEAGLLDEDMPDVPAESALQVELKGGHGTNGLVGREPTLSYWQLTADSNVDFKSEVKVCEVEAQSKDGHKEGARGSMNSAVEPYRATTSSIWDSAEDQTCSSAKCSPPSTTIHGPTRPLPPRLLPCPKPPTIPTSLTQELWRQIVPQMQAYAEEWRSYQRGLHHYRAQYHDYFLNDVVMPLLESCGYYVDWLKEDNNARELLEIEHRRQRLCMEQWLAYGLKVFGESLGEDIW